MPKTAMRKKTVLGRGLGSLLGASSEKEEGPSKTSPQQVDVETPPLPKKTQIRAPEAKGSAKTASIEASMSQNIDFQEPRVWQIGVEKLEPRSDQPRKNFDPKALRQLADSIKQQGILQPIVARKKGEIFEILAGERRWRAAALVGLNQVPVLLNNESNEQKLSELALIENIQREDLNPIEEAEAYQKLIQNYNLDPNILAKKLGKPRTTVSNILRLLKLGPELREAMTQGQLSTGQAKVLLSVEDPELQLQLGQQVIQRSLTVAQTTRLVQQASKTPKQRADFAQIEERLNDELQKNLGTKVSVKYDKGKASVWLRFYSDEELNEFIEKVREAWGSS